eukprot:7552198-Alexandrium_andersonii.AAC.1
MCIRDSCCRGRSFAPFRRRREHRRHRRLIQRPEDAPVLDPCDLVKVGRWDLTLKPGRQNHSVGGKVELRPILVQRRQ